MLVGAEMLPAKALYGHNRMRDRVCCKIAMCLSFYGRMRIWGTLQPLIRGNVPSFLIMTRYGGVGCENS